MHVLARCSIIILYFLLFTFLKRLEEESKKSNVRDVSCVAILSGRLTGVGGQSIAYVRKKQYLCRRIQRSTIKLFHNKCGCLEFLAQWARSEGSSSSHCKHYVRFTSGALQGLNLNTRKRDVRSANEMRTVASATRSQRPNHSANWFWNQNY